MKVRVWSFLCYCLIFSTCLLAVSACWDTDKRCNKDKCDQPGIGDRCKKTCGQCHNATIQTECPEQTWGTNCQKNCSVGCKKDKCDKTSGVCDCKPCYQGSNCRDVSDRCNCNLTGVCECEAGSYGTGCKQDCPHNCLNERCGSNGSCTQGCNTGWHGVRCDKCSEHCVKTRCTTSGTCMGGCGDGWFGKSCGIPCPDNCNSVTCDKNNGSCTLCHSGYAGPHCNTSCPEKCKGKTCNQTDRTCPACEFGWFGRTCTSTCPENCEGESCNQTDGACSKCKVGWFGRWCNYTCSHCKTDQNDNQCDQHMQSCMQGCTDGWFGDTCEHQCSKGCEKELCEQETGTCTEGCHQGVYGEFCNMSCSERCKDQICSAAEKISLSGDTRPFECNFGCESGWFGNNCSSPCPSGCESCTRVDGRCSTSGISGLVVWVVLPMIIITLLLIVTALLVARTKKEESFKLCRNLLRNLVYKDTSVFYPESTEDGMIGTPTLHCDKVQLLSLRQYNRSRGRDTNMLTYSTPLHEFTSPLLPYRPPLQQDRHQHPIPPPLPSYTSSDTEGPHACHAIPDGQPACLTSTEIRLEVFRDYVEAMKLNLGLSNQFYDLPFGKLGPCQEAEKSNNAFKNRYRNILPYDHSRVTLQSIENIPDSDYVNANYIHGYGTSQTFIATQGPYDDVMWDFWRMVWEVNCGKIVMLTNLVESRKVKCQQYWPEPGEKMDNDGVVVQSVSQMELPDFTVRNFAVQMKGRTLRTIQQFHYTTWPDKGVPRDVMSLVDFHQSVKQAPSSQSGPIIVHCSAGVGRTGTFIALDYLLAQAKAEGAVDVFECVTRLRHQRMDLIQTEEQYIFLHEALLEALPSGDRPSREVIRSERGRNDSSETITMVTNDLTHSSGSDHTYEAIEDVSRMAKCKDRSRKRMLPEVPEKDDLLDIIKTQR